MTDRPLLGRRVVVLRADGEVDSVREALGERGAEATTLVVARTVDRPAAEVRTGVGDLARFRWVTVTSQHAARRLVLWADRWPATTRVGVVGPHTRAVAERLGVRVALVAPGGTARSLAASIVDGPVLFLAAASAREDLVRDLAARGVEVVTVVAYDVVPRALDAADAATLLSSEAIVAMSPGAIDALCALAEAPREGARRVPLVAIGPTTADRASALGWPVATTADARDAATVREAVRHVLAR